MLEYATTKIKTGGNLLLKRFFSSWRWGKVTYPCKRLLQAHLQSPDNKGLSKIVTQDVLVVLVQLLLPGFDFQTPSQSSPWDRESTPFQMPQAGKQRHVKSKAWQLAHLGYILAPCKAEILLVEPFSILLSHLNLSWGQVEATSLSSQGTEHFCPTEWL